MPDPAVLFDLDGVLADSLPTISSALTEALVSLGYEAPAPEHVRRMVGPPLRLAFAELFGAAADSATVSEAVEAYRSRYRTALKATTGFAGIPEALDELAAAGLRLGVATSKPLAFAEPVLAALGLRERFDVVEGPQLDGTEDKSITVERALAALGEGVFALVGDRSFDVNAAHAHGLRAVGVLWGIGDRAELEAAGADVIVAGPAELPAALRR